LLCKHMLNYKMLNWRLFRCYKYNIFIVQLKIYENPRNLGKIISCCRNGEESSSGEWRQLRNRYVQIKKTISRRKEVVNIHSLACYCTKRSVKCTFSFAVMQLVIHEHEMVHSSDFGLSKLNLLTQKLQ
jgi:hypothetical protein